MSVSEAIIKPIIEILPSAWKWCSKKLSLFKFKIFANKRPYNDFEAKKIAQGVLSGRVEEAHSFRNVNSTKTYLAVLHRDSMEDHMLSFVLLKQLGNSFEKSYETELFRFPTDFEIVDIDKDGIHEVAYIIKDGGSGAGTNTLKVYSLKHKKLYELCEFFEWQNALTAEVSDVSITEDIPPLFKEYFEKYAVKKGFLQKRPVNLSKAENAVQNWHSMNGEKNQGKIRLHFYSGAPQFGSSIVDSIKTEAVTWIAHFKGPLIGYIKATQEHFIAYSPANTYHWPKSIAANNSKVFFTTQIDNGLYVFSYENNQGRLLHLDEIGSKKLPEIKKLNLLEEKLILNNDFEISLDQIPKDKRKIR